MLRPNFALALALAASVAVAQGPRNQGKGGMMGGMGKHMEHHTGMPGGMHDALHEAAVTAFGLAGMKAELGLSTQQEARFRRQRIDLRIGIIPHGYIRNAETLQEESIAPTKQGNPGVDLMRAPA